MLLGELFRRAFRRLSSSATPRSPAASAAYWEKRYAGGGDSGAGSYGRFADFKAEVLNEFVEAHAIRNVIELGCGDGNQLVLARYPEYLGLDVSPAAVARCRERFASDAGKSFRLMSEYRGEKA